MSDARFPADVYASRLRRAAAAAETAGLGAVLVGTGPDLRYLTGSRAVTFERLTLLVLPSGADPVLVAPKLELAALRESAVGELGVEVRAWVDGEDPYAIAAGVAGGGRFGVSEELAARHLIPLAAAIGRPAELATPVLRELRMHKDAAEIDALRRAGAAIDAVHARVPEWLRPGRTEREVAVDIEAAMIEAGHTTAEFIIVGSGPNGADPHHEVSDRVLQAGDVVVVDIGGPVEPGYNSDSTRTYSIGEPAPDVAAAYAALEAAQTAARAAARPGVTAESVDAAARDRLAADGLAEVFIHRTGHGIGLSVHEEPYIVAGNDLVLAEGMAFSIEPGVYFAGRWGARIEDIVIVTADGIESVNNRPRGLVVV